MAIDLAVTLWINGFAGRTFAVDLVGIIAATALLFIIGVAVIFVIAARTSTARAMFVVELVGTLIIAYAVSQFIGMVAFRERPFVRHQEIRQLIEKDAREKSFPSDHATLAFALAIPAAAVVRRRWGSALLLAAAAVVGLGRVFVGVHYVSDVIAGGLLACIVWFGVHRAVNAKIARFRATSVSSDRTIV
ncbi:phosphatase PAP2 family protein, partial [Candidatus Uhrbacteria bacterium]|nr:phosphatase PAP2 family protein [Candidatus Uhrbacteria bacterium]